MFLGDKARFRTVPPPWPAGIGLMSAKLVPSTLRGTWTAEWEGSAFVLQIAEDGRGALTESCRGKVDRWILVGASPVPTHDGAMHGQSLKLEWAYDSDTAIAPWLFERSLVLGGSATSREGELNAELTMLFGCVNLKFRRVSALP